MPTAATTSNKINWFYTTHLLVIFSLALVALPLVSKTAVQVFLVLYLLTVFGVSFSFHRYFSHRSFKMAKPLEYVTALLGTLAAQGGVFKWVAQHRMHHAFTETDRDPHSASQGFWHSHTGWLVYMPEAAVRKETLLPFARDVARDPFLMALSTFKAEVGLQLVLFAGLWAAFGIGVAMWGIFVRLAVAYNVTWLVNSYCHKFGYRRYDTKDFSTNSYAVGLLTFGDGFHNNHHACETAAFHGHKWWELDLTGCFIRLFAKLGWVWDVRPVQINPRPQTQPGVMKPALDDVKHFPVLR